MSFCAARTATRVTARTVEMGTDLFFRLGLSASHPTLPKNRSVPGSTRLQTRVSICARARHNSAKL
jgi:hypothetical protein